LDLRVRQWRVTGPTIGELRQLQREKQNARLLQQMEDARNRVIRLWTAPACNSSYNGCW
jgi:hypothetical protein